MPPIELWSGGETSFGGKAPDGGIGGGPHSGCKNEQQADFEVKLENRITDT